MEYFNILKDLTALDQQEGEGAGWKTVEIGRGLGRELEESISVYVASVPVKRVPTMEEFRLIHIRRSMGSHQQMNANTTQEDEQVYGSDTT